MATLFRRCGGSTLSFGTWRRWWRRCLDLFGSSLGQHSGCSCIGRRTLGSTGRRTVGRTLHRSSTQRVVAGHRVPL